jgi:hypothetical protein
MQALKITAVALGVVALCVASDGRGSGRVLAEPLPQCGGENEDSKDCSREGRQSPAGGAVDAAPVEMSASDCPKGSRDCFPDDRVGNRGSGRVALALWAAGLRV